MAQGDVGIFNEFLETLGKSEVNLDTDSIKVGLADDTTTPTASTADPRWGAGGTTNFATNQVTPGGNYSSGGPDISSTYSQSAGTATFDGSNIAISQNASNPTDARWGIIYDDTDADKKAIGWVDLGSVFDMTTGDLNINWNASGIFTIS
jgi:hypothetical protein